MPARISRRRRGVTAIAVRAVVAVGIGVAVGGVTASVGASGAAVAAPAPGDAAQPVFVFQQPTQVVGGVVLKQSITVTVPVLESFQLATAQAGPGTVRMWIDGNNRECLTPATSINVAWGNLNTGKMGVAELAPCASAPSPREALVTTGPGQVNFQIVVAGPARVELGSAGSVGTPGAPYLAGNGSFAVA